MSEHLDLAARLAALMAHMRPTSRFALETFLSAAEDPDIKGVELVLRAPDKPRDPLEAKLIVGPFE